MPEPDLTNLLARFPAPVRDAATTYGPAVLRLASKDFMALLAASQSGDAAKARDAMIAVRAAMTAEELATEKERLAELTRVMAVESWEARQLALSIARAGLAVAFAAAGL